MITQFPGYYRPTEKQFKTLWETCIIGVDANVLLNVYGYSEATREQLLGLLEKLSARIRMPYQFALEFQRNRAHAIMEQVKNYAKVEATLTKLWDEEFRPKTKHPFLTPKAVASLDIVRKELAKSRKQHEALFSEDPYFDRITTLVQSVSKKPTADELNKLWAEAKTRYAEKLPPGYADLKEKGEPGAFGDYIGWSQLKEFAKAEQKPLILLTDDAKEDWWQIQADRTIGPRPELIAEFFSECGKEFYMYSSDHFMRLAGKYLQQPVEQSAIEEVTARLLTQLREGSDIKSESKSQLKSVGMLSSESIQLDPPKASEPSPVTVEKSEGVTHLSEPIQHDKPKTAEPAVTPAEKRDEPTHPSDQN